MNNPTRKVPSFLLPLILFLIAIPFFSASPKYSSAKKVVNTSKLTLDSSEEYGIALTQLYDKLELNETGLSRKAFDYAIKGYEYLKEQGKLQNDKVLTIIDFSKPSDQKRLFVLDVENVKLLYHTYVAHGRNSGSKYATHFSNKPGSFMSSLGFYLTGNTYSGEHGYSLRLVGEEKGINDNALSRAIVMHCADYVSTSFIKYRGYIGRSLGCPALPKTVYKPIIQTIKEGSCLFIYAPSEKYTARSKVL